MKELNNNNNNNNEDNNDNDTYLLTITLPKSKSCYHLESLPLSTDGMIVVDQIQPLSLIFMSINSNYGQTSIKLPPIECEDGEELELENENEIIFQKEDPNLLILTLVDVKSSKYPSLSWTTPLPNPNLSTSLNPSLSPSLNVNESNYWNRIHDLFTMCLKLSNYNKNCFDPFLISPLLLDMMGYITSPSKTKSKSKYSHFSYQSTSDSIWRNRSISKEVQPKKIKKIKTKTQEKRKIKGNMKGDNFFMALEDDDDEDDESNESEEEEEEENIQNHEEICIDDIEEGENIAKQQQQQQQVQEEENNEFTKNISFPTNNKLYGNVRAICALDCEMCETSYGSELTRISIVCPVDGVILDKLVSYFYLFLLFFILIFFISYFIFFDFR